MHTGWKLLFCQLAYLDSQTDLNIVRLDVNIWCDLIRLNIFRAMRQTMRTFN